MKESLAELKQYVLSVIFELTNKWKNKEYNYYKKENNG